MGQIVPPSFSRLKQTKQQAPQTKGKKRPSTADATKRKEAAMSTNAAAFSQFSASASVWAYPTDIGAFHFRNPSFNGAYCPIDAEWILSSDSPMPEAGKLRFDFVSFDPQAQFMTSSMEFTSGNRMPIMLPITSVTEDADRLRREAFIDVLMNHVFTSSELLRYSAKMMEKKKLQPKNFVASSAKSTRTKYKSASSDQEIRAGLFDLSASAGHLVQQLDQELQDVDIAIKDNSKEDNEDDEDEDDEDDEIDDELEEEDEEETKLNRMSSFSNTATANSQGRVNSGIGAAAGRLGRSTFLKLQDQSEDIDTGVRQAFLRVNNLLSKAGSKDEQEAFKRDQTMMQQFTATRGMIVTNITQSSHNQDALQQPLLLAADESTKKPPLSPKKRNKTRPKIKHAMFRKNHTVYEKMHVAETAEWWRDYLETSSVMYIHCQRKSLIKSGALVYKDTLTSKELRLMDLTKLER